MEVSSRARSQIYFHLGYGNLQGIPVGDVAALQANLVNITNDDQYNRIKEILERCEAAWRNTQPGVVSSIVETYRGDINRTVQRNNLLATYNDLWEIYQKETDVLAAELNVVNYRHADARRNRFAAFGGEFIQSLPGVRDTSIGTRLYLFANFP